MGSLLKSTRNTRAILPDSLRFVRSDVPWRLADEEIRWLLTQNITTIVDLRTPEERLLKPCPLANDTRFRCYEMPVTGGGGIPSSVEDVSGSYIRMVDAQMEKIIGLIWNAPTNVLYFCNAGKDRTGVVSAILLCKAGMSREYIIRDYLESGDNLKSVLDSFARQSPEIDRAVITPQLRYILEFLDWYLPPRVISSE